MPLARLSIKSYTLTPRIHPRSVSRSASVVAGKTTSLQKGMADCKWAGTKSAVAHIRAGCGVRWSWRRVSWSSGSTVELRVCGWLKCYRLHVVYGRRLCVVPARLKNDLLPARPVYSVRARYLSGGLGNRSRREYTVGVYTMYRCTYRLVRTTTLIVLSSRLGILTYVHKPKGGL